MREIIPRTHLLVSENLECSLENIVDRLLAYVRFSLYIVTEYIVLDSSTSPRYVPYLDLYRFPAKIDDGPYSSVLGQQTNKRET
jgi:hypothetical protein